MSKKNFSLKITTRMGNGENAILWLVVSRDDFRQGKDKKLTRWNDRRQRVPMLRVSSRHWRRTNAIKIRERQFNILCEYRQLFCALWWYQIIIRVLLRRLRCRDRLTSVQRPANFAAKRSILPLKIRRAIDCFGAFFWKRKKSIKVQPRTRSAKINKKLSI